MLDTIAEERVRTAMRGRGGWGCDCAATRLVKRAVSSHWTVTIQCDVCGKAVGGAIKRENVGNWQSLPEWDGERHEKWFAEFRRQSIATMDARRASFDHARDKRSAEYAEWRRTSPDWHRIRDLVLQRANFRCEACLSAPASVVHHLTYEWGKLPPAWELRAVCGVCHDRIHADRHGRTDEWCQGAAQAAD